MAMNEFVVTKEICELLKFNVENNKVEVAQDECAQQQISAPAQSTETSKTWQPNIDATESVTDNKEFFLNCGQECKDSDGHSKNTNNGEMRDAIRSICEQDGNDNNEIFTHLATMPLSTSTSLLTPPRQYVLSSPSDIHILSLDKVDLSTTAATVVLHTSINPVLGLLPQYYLAEILSETLEFNWNDREKFDHVVTDKKQLSEIKRVPNDDVRTLTIPNESDNLCEIIRENYKHIKQQDDVNCVTTTDKYCRTEVNSNEGKIEIHQESSKAEAGAAVVTEIGLRNNVNGGGECDRGQFSVQQSDSVTNEITDDVVVTSAVETTMSIASAKSRRQRFKISKEKSEDSVERLNRLRAKISGAISEVKGVLKQYSTDQNIDDDNNGNDDRDKRIENLSTSTEEVTINDEPVRFRFIRKIRRTSVFSEDEEIPRNHDKCESEVKTEKAISTAEVKHTSPVIPSNDELRLNISEETAKNVSEIQLEKKELDHSLNVQQNENVKNNIEKETTPLPSIGQIDMPPQLLLLSHSNEHDNEHHRQSIEVKAPAKQKEKDLAKRIVRRASISTIKPSITSPLPLNFKSRRRPSDSETLVKINAEKKTSSPKVKIISDLITFVSPTKEEKAEAPDCVAKNFARASQLNAPTTTAATASTELMAIINISDDETDKSASEVQAKVTKSLVISSVENDNANQSIVSGAGDKTQLASSENESEIHYQQIQPSATTIIKEIEKNNENIIALCTVIPEINIEEQNSDIQQSLPIIEESTPKKIVANPLPSSDGFSSVDIKNEDTALPETSFKGSITTISNDNPTKPSSIRSKMPELAIAPIQIYGQPLLRHVSLLKPITSPKKNFGKFPLKLTLIKNNSIEKTPNNVKVSSKGDSIEKNANKPSEEKDGNQTIAAPEVIPDDGEVAEQELPKQKKDRQVRKKVIIRRLTRKLSVGEPSYKNNLEDDEDIEVVVKPIEYVKEIDVNDDQFSDDKQDDDSHPKPWKSCLKQRQFQVGDVVMYAERFKKTQVRWKKATVVERITSISYKLDVNGEEKPAHISYIKNYTERKVNFNGKEYLEIDYEQIDEEEPKQRKYSIWDMV